MDRNNNRERPTSMEVQRLLTSLGNHISLTALIFLASVGVMVLFRFCRMFAHDNVILTVLVWISSIVAFGLLIVFVLAVLYGFLRPIWLYIKRGAQLPPTPQNFAGCHEEESSFGAETQSNLDEHPHLFD